MIQQPVEGYTHTTNQVFLPGYNGFPLQSRPIKYNGFVVRIFGIIQMAIGIICVVFNIALLGIMGRHLNLSILGYGIWTGVIFFVAGLLSFLSGKKQPNKCLIISTMVMDIIAACFTPIVLTFGIIGPDGFTMGHPNFSEMHNVNTALSAIMAILAFIEAAIAITGSAFCCRVICCNGNPNAIDIPYYFPTNQQGVYMYNNSAPFPGQNQPMGQFNYASQSDQESLKQIQQVPGGSELPPPAYESPRI